MTTDQIHWLSATELAAAYACGGLSPMDVTRTMLDRIAAVDGCHSGFETVAADQAMAAAKVATEEIAQGNIRSPLHGVPIAVKDLYDTAQLRTAAGTRMLRDNVPDRDATVMARLNAAGAVLLGKLKMTEGACSLHHPDVAPPLNPWGHEYWPGASSSGSGVATAGGYCFASLGSETVCSIRYPSALCGLVGLKPTNGRVSRAGVFALAGTLDHVGPMTRTVADAAAMLAVIAGVDDRDPSALSAPVPDYTAELARGVAGLRIGYDPAFNSHRVKPAITAAVEAAIAVLADQGAEIVEIKVPDCTAALMAAAITLHAGIAHAHRDYFPIHKDDYGPELRQYVEVGQTIAGADVAAAEEQRRLWSGQLRHLFAGIDLMISPTTTFTESVMAERPAGPANFLKERVLAPLRFTFPYAFSGHPAMTLPAGFADTGMPIAIQFTGPHLGESDIIRAGHAFQSATNWHLQHPATD
ncbi:MAG: amidase [Alphaproteobacteria bacterium]|nr:amidase [Alphaproteobacteria bacterium]